MWIQDVTKLDEYKAQIKFLQEQNAALISKLDSLEGENYFSIQGKVSELNNCYDQRFQESQTLSTQIRERFEKAQELDKQINAQQKQLTRLKEMYHSLDSAIKNYTELSFSYNQCRLEDKYLEECERLAPSIRLRLPEMDTAELHQAYLDKEQMINELFSRYAASFTSPADKAICELVTLSLKAEVQNVLFSLKTNFLEDSSNAVKKACRKHAKIACEGNQDLSAVFTKFIGELEYHFIDLVSLEYRYLDKKKTF